MWIPDMFPTPPGAICNRNEKFRCALYIAYIFSLPLLSSPFLSISFSMAPLAVHLLFFALPHLSSFSAPSFLLFLTASFSFSPPCSSVSQNATRMVCLPEQLPFKRRQGCFSPNCLWSGFSLHSAGEASSRKTS